MSSFTEIVASVVVHSSAAAFSHFGVQVDPSILERPAPSERVVNKTPQAARPEKVSLKAPDCPDLPRIPVLKA